MNTLRRNVCLFLLFLFSFTSIFLGGLFVLTASAEQNSVSQYLPQSNFEVLDLNSSAPAHATIYNGGSAIITENKKLFIYDNDCYVEYNLLHSNNPGQIRYLGNNQLLVNDNLKLYTIDLSDLTLSPQPFNCENEQISSSYFDINGNYLTTISNNQIFLYRIDGTEVTSLDISSEAIPKLQSPVCVNKDGKIFFIRLSDSKLCVYDGTENTGTPMFNLPLDGISNMASKNGVLYFTRENLVWCVDENTKNSDTVILTQLQCSEKFNDYDLGSIQNPTDMHFYGENLIITDSQKNAVQQFSIVDNQLVFTGKAIARDKTSYNRISSQAFKINVSKENVAVLDDFKLTLLPNSDTFDRYSTENYQNYLVTELANPTTFALGNTNVLLGYENGVKKLDVLTGQLDTQITPIPNLKSIIFVNDKYYILANDSSFSKIFVADENLTQLTEIYNEELNVNLFTVDVFGNLYTYNQTELYKNGSQFCSETGITQLFTDLNGNLYSVKENKVRYFNTTQSNWTDYLEFEQNVKSVANNVYTDDLYILQENSEYIYKCNPDGYACISDINIPEDYKFTDKTVTNQLKTYNIKHDACAYSIKTTDTVEYLKHAQLENEYVFITKTNVDGVNGQVEYVFLAGENGITLTHTSSSIEQTINYDTEVSEKVYVATDVNVYYFPIITKSNIYVLTYGENVIRLKKGAVFAPLNKFNFDGIEYYYANVGTEENAVYGYVPVNFTVNVLSENVNYSTFTIEKVTNTTLYSDKDLTQAILEIEEGKTVRVYQEENGILKVWYQTENGFIEGYISKDSVMDNPNLQVRNILLILAVSACLCGSVTYFVLKSKRD